MTGDNSQLIQSLNQTKQALEQFNEKTIASGQSIENMLNKAKGFAGAAAGFAGISFGGASFLKQMVQVRSEFQNTEAMFKVFLGSAEKASNFTKELQDAAYWNVFEFKDLTEGAAQLLAYKTSQEDVIPTIQKLSEVAAGTNKPIGDMIEMFNRVKSTDMIDDHMLRRLKSAGLDVQEIVADLRGVSKSVVSTSSLGFNELQQALDAVTSEGGRYYGMMEEKMKTLGDSVGLLQDNVTAMFNEMGASSQGFLKGGINALNWMVEHYEALGKTILMLVSVYGAYKTAVAVTTVVTKVATEMNKGYTLSQMIQYKWELLLEKAVIKKNLAIMASNPILFAVTAAVLALVAAIVIFSDKSSDEEKALDRVNNQYDKRMKKQQELIDQAGEYIETINNEKAAADDLATAYEGLQKMEPFKGMSQEEITALGKEGQQQKIDEYESQEKKKAQDDVLSSNIESYAKNMVTSDSAGNPLMSGVAATIAGLIAGKKADNKMDNVEAMASEIANTNVASLKDLDEATRKVKYDELIKGIEDSTNALNDNQKSVEEGTTEYYQNEAQLAANAKMLEVYKSNLEGLNNVTSAEPVTTTVSESLSSVKAKMAEAQQEIDDIRSGKKLVEDPGKAISDAETKISGYVSTIKTLTGQQYVDKKTLTENQLNLDKAAVKKELDFHKSQLKDKRNIIQAELEQRLNEIYEEEKAFNKANNGGTAASRRHFKELRNIARAEMQTEYDQLDKDFEQWKANFQKNLTDIGMDIHLSELENAVELADTYNEKVKARAALHEAEIEKIRQANKEAMKNDLENQFGKEVMDAVNSGKTSYSAKIVDDNGNVTETTIEIPEETLDRIAEAKDLYAQLGAEQERQSNVSFTQESSKEALDNYRSYNEQMVELAQWRADELNKIQLGESEMTAGQVEAAYNQNAKVIQKEHGIEEGSEGAEISQIAENLTASLAGATVAELNAAYQTFLKDAQDKMDELDQQKLDNEAAMAEQQAIVESEGSTDKEKVAAEQQIESLKKQQLVIDQNRAMLQNTMKNSEKQMATAMKNTTDQSSQQAKVNSKKWDLAAQSISLANDACEALANSLGGSMSKGGKKALNVMKSITQFATSNIGNIKTLAEISIKSTEGVADGAAASMSAAEKASVILTIISMAIQAIQAIVNLVKQFSEEAQLQETIDEDIERVEALKKAQERLNDAYQSKVGTEYYTGMAHAAKNYDEVIAAQTKAVEDAQKLAELQEKKHGSDSDKAKDAADQAAEQEQALYDLKKEQEEMYREMAEDLLTTNVTSFAENMADNMVESFSQGIGGIEAAWDSTLDELLKNMMKKGLSIALTNLFSGVWDEFSNKTKDGALTQGEMDEIMRKVEERSEQAKDIAETYYNAMSERGLLDEEGPEGSKGGFTNMSQDSADELNARFTALQIEGAEVVSAAQTILGLLTASGATEAQKISLLESISQQSILSAQIAQNQLDELRTIAEHTSALAETNRRLKAIETNTDRL